MGLLLDQHQLLDYLLERVEKTIEEESRALVTSELQAFGVG